LETKLKLQLTTDKKSDFRYWNKGEYDYGFEDDWGTWTDLKLTSGFPRICTAKTAINNN